MILDMSTCEYDMYAKSHMIRQRSYRPPGSHPDTGNQIDCGIYYLLMVLLHLNGISLSTLTPHSVHQFRIFLAHCILHHLFPVNIDGLIQPSAYLQDMGSMVEACTENALVLTPSSSHNNTEYEQPIHTNEGNIVDCLLDKADKHSTSRHHLHRRARPSFRTDQQIPLPPGRILLNIIINDEAFDHSYAAPSTLSDISNNIDAGAGLFAKRYFSYESPLDEWDLVGYYIGCKPLTTE